MLWPDFIGGSNMVRSQNMDLEATINLYQETIGGTGNAKQKVLYGTPGLVPQITAGTIVCRGMFSQDGRTFAVIGNILYELTIVPPPAYPNVTALTNRGTLANDGSKVYFASNGQGGNQLAISSAGNLYIFGLLTNVLSAAIVLPLVNPAGQVAFLNSFFLLVETSSLKVFFSAFEDGTSWNALDFFARSNRSDNVVGMQVIHDVIRVFGSRTSEIFYNVGDPNNPFLPYPGSLTEDGAVNAASIGLLNDSVVWLSRNEQNVSRFMRASGTGPPQVLSTPAIDVALASYATVTDAEILVYQQEGHTFAIWTFSTADQTWAFDDRENTWHERARWDNTGSQFHQWRARGCCAPGSQMILVGDAITGDIYNLSLDRFDDNCTLLKRLRRAPYLSAENQWLFIDQIELGMQGGVGTASGAGVNANVNLRVSKDSGNTYSAVRSASMGTIGNWNARAIWRRLGRVRSDRLVLEVSQTDPVRAVWGPGLWIRSAPGTAEL